jgi:hypothetical protein
MREPDAGVLAVGFGELQVMAFGFGDPALCLVEFEILRLDVAEVQPALGDERLGLPEVV